MCVSSPPPPLSALELTPARSAQLFFRGARVAFLCPLAHALAPSRLGDVRHVLSDALVAAAQGLVPAVQVQRVPLSRVRQAFRDAAAAPVGAVIVHP